MLPAIRAYAQRAFFRLKGHDHDEAVQAVIAFAVAGYARLVQRERADRGYATTLANMASGSIAPVAWWAAKSIVATSAPPLPAPWLRRPVLE